MLPLKKSFSPPRQYCFATVSALVCAKTERGAADKKTTEAQKKAARKLNPLVFPLGKGEWETEQKLGVIADSVAEKNDLEYGIMGT